jgi:hypothetical protein
MSGCAVPQMGWQMTLKLKQWRSKKTQVPIETKGRRTLLFRKDFKQLFFLKFFRVESIYCLLKFIYTEKGGVEKGIHIAWQHCRDT